MKNLLMIAIATFGLAAITMAQVPNYVPTNGLVGWWPFTGNANDESGNGNNATNTNATITTDRNGIGNSAYTFNGSSNFIEIPDSQPLRLSNTDFTISFWVNVNTFSNGSNVTSFLCKRGSGSNNGWIVDANSGDSYALEYCVSSGSNPQVNTITTISSNVWHNLIVRYSLATQNITFYYDGVLDSSPSSILPTPNSSCSSVLRFGWDTGSPTGPYWLNGKLDDIGIWNRVLTQQEITNLYNAANCANNTAITPQTNSLATGSTATFTASTTDPNPTYVWQSDLGQGFQTLNNFGNYSGVNTASLNVTNVQLSEHNQPIRVISTSGNCIDTSNVAVINILDTCITNVTIYDTILTTVTDTLIINATITGLNPPSNQNTLKVFPNPANTHITIDYGNFSSMNGYTLKIVNATGQTVFTTFINQQNSYIDLSTWTGNGIYYVQLIDTQNNTIENRKIVIH